MPQMLLIALGFALIAYAYLANAWEDRSADDMPWLGSGRRARLYYRQSSCLMCPTGFQSEERWGRFAWFGEEPYTTVAKAMRYLRETPIFANAPVAKGAGSIGDDSGIIVPRALPYHFTVVMIEPTVVIMNFDLGALTHEGEPQQGNVVGTPYIDGYVSYGTTVQATGTLMWFSPTEKAGPSIVDGQTSGLAEIVLKAARIKLERRGGEWSITPG
jgi:hypothetical protein